MSLRKGLLEYNADASLDCGERFSELATAIVFWYPLIMGGRSKVKSKGSEIRWPHKSSIPVYGNAKMWSSEIDAFE